ncbi:uncharacterized protein V3H86_014628 [Mergus octosetaceus]
MLLDTLNSFLEMVETLFISGNNSGLSGEQNLPQILGSAPDIDAQSSDVVQGNHSSCPQQGLPAPERSVKTETGEGDVSIKPEPRMGQETMDVPVQPSTSFPVAVKVDAGPQPKPEATMQPALPEMVLPGERNQLQENEGAPLQTGQQLSKAEELLPKKAGRKTRKRKFTPNKHCNNETYMMGLERRKQADPAGGAQKLRA